MAEAKVLLKVGEKMPFFSLPDQHGNVINIEILLAKKTLVIYFYPKDYTPGCTAEACGFRDQYEVFKEHGAEVIGISTDGSARHSSFAKSYGLDFILLSDRDRKAEKLFGVPRSMFGLLGGRVTFIVDQSGIIRHVFQSRSQATQHVEEALKVVRELNKKAKPA